ncbi:hypothetical protein PGT21_018676 [Puccinia graminis f. sp. tritici]|uniref:Uncharacterized protein n=1 Tax=Puccinia graminis f. sp. tritici TaxID=56615 RepID=A0A5B0LKL2_PUCGR|nr:hypothetical protein PGT21_018676 [Puccinia graminis f. sp. tritici]
MAISHISPRLTATNDQPSSPMRTPRPLISKTVQLSSPVQKPQEIKSRKKEFPSVAKLLDGISFQDETHPDFFLRASRFKPKKPILHPSELILPRPSSSSSRYLPENLIASHPLSSSDALKPATVPACSSSSTPLLSQRTSDSTTTTSSSSSFSPRSPADSCPSSPVHHTTINSLKRVYTSSSEEDDESDEDGDDEDSEEKNSTRSSESSDERALKRSSAFGLGIVWQTGLGERGSSPEAERPIARPSRTWLTKTSLERTSPAKSSAASSGAAGGVDDAGYNALNGRSEGPLLGLVSSRSIEIRQTDKRRRFLHGVRFHQVIR